MLLVFGIISALIVGVFMIYPKISAGQKIDNDIKILSYEERVQVFKKMAEYILQKKYFEMRGRGRKNVVKVKKLLKMFEERKNI